MKILLSGGLKSDSKIVEQLKLRLKPAYQIQSDWTADQQSHRESYDFHVYIIAPGMKGIMPVVRPEYNKKELDFAIKYNKRIIPVMHVALGQDITKLDSIVAKKVGLTGLRC